MLYGPHWWQFAVVFVFPKEEAKSQIIKRLGCTPEETRPWTPSLAGSGPTQHSRRHRRGAAPPSATPSLPPCAAAAKYNPALFLSADFSNRNSNLLPTSNRFFRRRSSLILHFSHLFQWCLSLSLLSVHNRETRESWQKIQNGIDFSARVAWRRKRKNWQKNISKLSWAEWELKRGSWLARGIKIPLETVSHGGGAGAITLPRSTAAVSFVSLALQKVYWVWTTCVIVNLAGPWKFHF